MMLGGKIGWLIGREVLLRKTSYDCLCCGFNVCRFDELIWYCLLRYRTTTRPSRTHLLHNNDQQLPMTMTMMKTKTRTTRRTIGVLRNLHEINELLNPRMKMRRMTMMKMMKRTKMMRRTKKRVSHLSCWRRRSDLLS
jgi:hypothetical protein